MSTRRDRSFVALAMVLVTLVLMGCSLLETADSVGAEKMREEERARLDEAAKAQEEAVKAEQEAAKAEPDQALASGEVLSVRVNYGDSGATQCQVRIDNERNGWYDEVEWTAHAGTLGAADKMYDDFGFGSENFNKQTTNPFNAPLYTPEAVNGEYVVTVTASTGFSTTVRTTWDGERFSPNLLSFSLD